MSTECASAARASVGFHSTLPTGVNILYPQLRLCDLALFMRTTIFSFITSKSSHR